MSATAVSRPQRRSHRKWIAASVGLVLAVAVFLVSLFASGATPVSADNAGVAPPLVEQCNDSGDLPGGELRCTIDVVNYLNADGTLASSPDSTVTVTICEGAESGGEVACADPVTSVSATPVTTARQCNFAYYGGGSWIECTVTITNHWIGDPSPTAATIWQCVGSPITGTGAPGTCDPLEEDNTALSEVDASIAQCNRSGYGGTTPADGFICTVSPLSTTTAALPIRVDQCNDSGYGGGTTVRCTATVTNQFLAEPTPTPTPEPTPTPTATPTPTPTPTVVQVIVPVFHEPPTPPLLIIVMVPPEPTSDAETIVLPPVVIPPGVGEVVLPAVVVPPVIKKVIVPVIVPPGVVVQAVPVPASTGDAGLVERGGTSAAVAGLVGIAALGLVLAARRLASRRSRR